MSKYSFTTNPISSVYRLVPPNKPWVGEFSRVYAVQVRHFDPPDIRGEIESNLTLQRCKEGFTNRVTIITSKCGYSWNRFLRVWICKANIIVSGVLSKETMFFLRIVVKISYARVIFLLRDKYLPTVSFNVKIHQKRCFCLSHLNLRL